jgi:hypothetical protein
MKMQEEHPLQPPLKSVLWISGETVFVSTFPEIKNGFWGNNNEKYPISNV